MKNATSVRAKAEQQSYDEWFKEHKTEYIAKKQEISERFKEAEANGDVAEMNKQRKEYRALEQWSKKTIRDKKAQIGKAIGGVVEYGGDKANVQADKTGIGDVGQWSEETSKTVNGGLRLGTLSNVEARKWYLESEAKIPNLIDDSLPLEKQAKKAFDLRNQFRTKARELMADRELAKSLYITDPNLTWEQVVQKQIDKGLSGDDIFKAIIKSSQRSRTSVNKKLGIK